MLVCSFPSKSPFLWAALHQDLIVLHSPFPGDMTASQPFGFPFHKACLCLLFHSSGSRGKMALSQHRSCACPESMWLPDVRIPDFLTPHFSSYTLFSLTRGACHPSLFSGHSFPGSVLLGSAHVLGLLHLKLLFACSLPDGGLPGWVAVGITCHCNIFRLGTAPSGMAIPVSLMCTPEPRCLCSTMPCHLVAL